MSGEFDVFDEWGSYVGKFTPAGGGWDGCFFAIAMLILWTIGFLVYLLVRLVVQGFRAAGRREWDKAAAYWAIPGLIAFVFVAMMVSGVVTGVAQESERQALEQQQQEQQQEFDLLVREGRLLEITRVRNEIPLGEGVGCGSSCSGFVYGEYEITNLSDFTLEAWSNWWSCNFPDGVTVGPGQRMTVYCAEDNGGIDRTAYIEIGLSGQDDVCKWVDVLPMESLMFPVCED